MPVIGSDSESLKEYLGNNEQGRIYLGSTLVQGGPNDFLVVRGGTITTDGDYKIHTFSTIGTASLYIDELSDLGYNDIEYYVIGGGGAGQNNLSGLGGGAGGLVTGSRSLTLTDIGTYEVIVGAGGQGNNYAYPATAGENSRISGPFTYLAYGGGSYPTSPNGGSGAGLGTTLDSSQGNNGGTITAGRPAGGGAGAVGGEGTTTPPLVAGAGGAGLYVAIFNQYVCCGGGSGGQEGDANNRQAGAGGFNGGGAGGDYQGTTANKSGKNATTYGSAGGGIGENRNDLDAVSGNGYQGIIAIKYRYK